MQEFQTAQALCAKQCGLEDLPEDLAIAEHLEGGGLLAAGASVTCRPNGGCLQGRKRLRPHSNFREGH